MPQADPKSPSRPQKIQKLGSLNKCVAVDFYNIEFDNDTCTMLNQSSKLTEGDLLNDPDSQSPQELREMIVLDSDEKSGFRACKADQAERLLEPPPNDDRPNYQGGMGSDDPFAWEVERVVQYFNSTISSPTFEDALRSHQIAGWILLWEVSSEVMREELLVEDLAQQDIIWNSILELRQNSKGYHEWTAEWGFDTSL